MTDSAPRRDWRQRAALALSALPPLLALALCASALGDQRGVPLQPDAANYLQLADTFGWERLWGGVREPVWPLLLAGPIAIAGPEPMLLRSLGLLFFPLLVVAFQRLATAVVAPVWAAFGAVLVAISPWLRVQALEGLREIPAAAGLLLLVAALVRRQGSYGFRDGLLLGAGAALLALLRWDTILVSVPLLLVSAVARRASARDTAAALATLAVLTAPLTLGNLQRYGDPMYHSNIHAVFFRNIEFGGRPGHPTTEELAKDGYAGPPTSWAAYLFKDRPLGDLKNKTLEGGPIGVLEISKVAATGRARHDHYALQLPPARDDLLPWGFLLSTALGIVLLLLRRQWHLALFAPLVVFQLAPVQHIMDARLGISVYPVGVLCVLVVLDSLTGHLSFLRTPGTASAAGRQGSGALVDRD